MVDGTVYDGIPNRPLYFDQKEMRFSVLCNREWCRSTTQWALHVSMDRCLRLFFKHFKAFQDSHWTAPKGSCRNSMTQVVDSWPQQFLGHMSRYVQSFCIFAVCWIIFMLVLLGRYCNIKITMLQLQLHICFLLGILSRTFIKWRYQKAIRHWKQRAAKLYGWHFMAIEYNISIYKHI